MRSTVAAAIGLPSIAFIAVVDYRRSQIDSAVAATACLTAALVAISPKQSQQRSDGLMTAGRALAATTVVDDRTFVNPFIDVHLATTAATATIAAAAGAMVT